MPRFLEAIVASAQLLLRRFDLFLVTTIISLALVAVLLGVPLGLFALVASANPLLAGLIAPFGLLLLSLGGLLVAYGLPALPVTAAIEAAAAGDGGQIPMGPVLRRGFAALWRVAGVLAWIALPPMLVMMLAMLPLAMVIASGGMTPGAGLGAFAGGSLLSLVGLAVAVVWGLVRAVRGALAPAAVVAENLGVMDAWHRSRDLTAGAGLPILLSLLVLGLALGLLSDILGRLLGPFGALLVALVQVPLLSILPVWWYVVRVNEAGDPWADSEPAAPLDPGPDLAPPPVRI